MAPVTVALASFDSGWDRGHDGCLAAFLIVVELQTCLIMLVVEGFILLPEDDTGAHQALNSGSACKQLIHQAVFVKVGLETFVGLSILVRIP